MSFNATDTVNYSKNFTFGMEDYTILGLMLAISTAIGIYFGFFSVRNNTADEYLLGGKRMTIWPIAISLIASQLSGISVIAIPAEMYSFGFTYVFISSSMIFVVPILCYFVLPVFYENNISNCYEYLELRFNKKTRKIVTFAYILTTFLYLPVYIFIPSLAFSQVTGNNVHIVNGIVCFVCVMYTMLGGIKAVVWTDVIQGGIMVGSIILIGVIGTLKAGGVSKVIDNAIDGGRLQVNIDLDPRVRATVWNCFFGGFCLWIGSIGLNQTCVQRIVALPSVVFARRSLVIAGIGFFVIMTFNCLTGIIMYALYYNCDPLKLKIVDKSDKLMPYFVQDVAGHLTGMPGVFISCVFSAALSTISANLNSLSGIFYFDCVKPFIKHHTEQKANFVMKAFVFFSGIYCISGGFIVEQFNSILQTVLTIGGLTQGSIVGVFFLGLLVPKAHGKAALVGLVSSMMGVLCIFIGAQIRIKAGELSYAPLPTRTDGCLNNITLNTSIFKDNFREESFPKDIGFNMFDISFYWYKFIGVVLVWIIAVPLSYLTPERKAVNVNLLSPFVKNIMKRKQRSTTAASSSLTEEHELELPNGLIR
ncbi:sodium-coupled monocarboxylate transporter 1-like [Episyrphus balteatus]|uniref:sodium-coupled monocarboxylate transporter 1-like n=1 Tax=Episyrphus balteatus TaxID=286459 RepID=UPI00248560E1|nr:sodium-coupled monocarboxylate transporter 1-like [Episyrphus balteatus]